MHVQRLTYTLALGCLALSLLLFTACGGSSGGGGSSSTGEGGGSFFGGSGNNGASVDRSLSVEGYEYVRDARFSPDNTKIAMFAENGDGTHLIVTDLNGKNPSVLVEEGLGYLSTVAWFPDGDTVAFASDSGIERIDLTPSSPRTLIVDAFAVSSVDVSPDGTEVIWFVNGRSQLTKAPIGDEPTGRDEEVTGPDGSVPRFSPDGSKILFMNNDTFYTVDANFEQEPVEVAQGGDYLSNGAWIDNSTVLLLINGDIVRVDLNTGTQSSLTSAFAGKALDASPDGSLYIYGINGRTDLNVKSL